MTSRSYSLKSLVGVLGEPLMQADTVMRRAANSVTMDAADALEAGVVATVGGIPGGGGWNERYKAAQRAQDGRDAYDLKHRTGAVVAGEALGAYLGYRAGAGPLGTKALTVISPWKNSSKGRIGDGLSVVKTLSKGDLPINFQKPMPVRGGETKTDQQTLRKIVVESKLRLNGRRGSLTARQKEAKAMLGERYREDHWGPNDIRRATGATGLGAVAGTRAADERRQR